MILKDKKILITGILTDKSIAYASAQVALENGAQVNIADINGDTPLDWAISKKNMELDLLLRKYGGKTSSMMK